MSAKPLSPVETVMFIDERMSRPLQWSFGGGAIAAFIDACPDSTPGRPNEDACAIIRFSEHEAVIAVADGAGGMPSGAEASAAAVRALVQAIETAAEQQRTLRAGILDGFELADQAVRGLGVGAATTLAVAELRPEGIRSYHAGDSAVAVVGQRGKVKLTIVPHSPVGYGVEAGLIRPEDALHHDDLNLVSNLLGLEGMRIEVGTALELSPRDTVVVGSDGLFDNLHLAEVAELVRTGPLDEAADGLRQKCLQRMNEPEDTQPSKPDDLSFVLYRPMA